MKGNMGTKNKDDKTMEELVADVAVLKSELKTLVSQHAKHCEDDKEIFGKLFDKLSRVERLGYIGVGLIMAVEFFFKR